MKKHLLAAVLSALAVSLGSAAHAGIVYDNGAPNRSNGNEMTAWIQSEDFTLTSASLVEAVRFWSIDSGLADGTIAWQIYSDVSGAPGTALFSGVATDTRTSGAVLGFGTEHINDFSLGSLSLAAGTYHLALHNGAMTGTARKEFYWETTGPNATAGGLENGAPFADNSFVSNTQQHAFQLVGGATVTEAAVPEPETLALLGFGVFGLFLGRRRAARRD